jgi:hypothetical protein
MRETTSVVTTVRTCAYWYDEVIDPPPSQSLISGWDSAGAIYRAAHIWICNPHHTRCECSPFSDRLPSQRLSDAVAGVEPWGVWISEVLLRVAARSVSYMSATAGSSNAPGAVVSTPLVIVTVVKMRHPNPRSESIGGHFMLAIYDPPHLGAVMWTGTPAGDTWIRA